MSRYQQAQAIGSLPSWQSIGAFLNGAIVLVAAAVVATIFLIVAGYSDVRFVSLPANAAVRLNGHLVHGSIVKLRPGSYRLLIASPTTKPIDDTIRVGLLHSTTYRPKLEGRSPDAIAAATFGAVPGTAQTPQFAQSKQFDDGWIAGSLSLSETVVALHYDTSQKTWVLAFCTNDGCPQDLNQLPAAVASYVRQLSVMDMPEGVSNE